MLHCELFVSSFTKGKLQLSAKDAELSRTMSRVRIYVERVTGVLKNWYTILQTTLPISLIKRPSDGDVTTIDKMMTVCCALCNMGESVVPLCGDQQVYQVGQRKLLSFLKIRTDFIHSLYTIAASVDRVFNCVCLEVFLCTSCKTFLYVLFCTDQ